MKRIYFTVTNDLTYDQRMHRICESLTRAGYRVCLVGRKLKTSVPLKKKSFRQKRIKCFFNKGFLFYLEYNLRLLFFLWFRKTEGICAIDLDTILPCYFVSAMKRVPRIYDAHEYFTELKEVRTRPLVRMVWLLVEKFCLPRFRCGYTVSEGIANEFARKYKRNYLVIRNLPPLKELTPGKRDRILLYQGAVNEGRGFEYLIPAMRSIDCNLVICGDGNFMPRLKRLIAKYRVRDKVELMGMLLPDKLYPLAQRASLGIGLAEKEGLNQYLALPNKFFDYIHAGLPQIAMDFPEYRKINEQYKVAELIPELSVEGIAKRINEVMENQDAREEMHRNCLEARNVYCWQEEEKILTGYYHQIFGS